MNLASTISMYCESNDDSDCEWRTINGQHICIRPGENAKQAFDRTLSKEKGISQKSPQAPKSPSGTGEVGSKSGFKMDSATAKDTIEGVLHKAGRSADKARLGQSDTYDLKSLSSQVAEIMGKQEGLDSRVFEKKPLKQIYVSTAEADAKNTESFYDPEERKIVLGKGTIGLDPLSYIHEYGHHLFSAWLAPITSNPGEGRMKSYSGEIGGYEKRGRGGADVNAMYQEYKKVADTVNEKLGHSEGIDGLPSQFGRLDVLDTTAFARDQLEIRKMNLPTAVSNYALANTREWFSESFKEYFASPTTKTRLQEIAPNTYKVIDKMVHGRYLKDA